MKTKAKLNLIRIITVIIFVAIFGITIRYFSKPNNVIYSIKTENNNSKQNSETNNKKESNKYDNETVEEVYDYVGVNTEKSSTNDTPENLQLKDLQLDYSKELSLFTNEELKYIDSTRTKVLGFYLHNYPSHKSNESLVNFHRNNIRQGVDRVALSVLGYFAPNGFYITNDGSVYNRTYYSSKNDFSISVEEDWTRNDYSEQNVGFEYPGSDEANELILDIAIARFCKDSGSIENVITMQDTHRKYDSSTTISKSYYFKDDPLLREMGGFKTRLLKYELNGKYQSQKNISGGEFIIEDYFFTIDNSVFALTIKHINEIENYMEITETMLSSLKVTGTGCFYD